MERIMNEAAWKIQKKWRSYIDTQVFKYYKGLICFKNRGHPAMILRCINPREAGLFDAAAGIKVRFRLAGPEFPPCIYYKVYTERNIVDVCASSPKNYCQNSNRQKSARNVNNKTDENEEKKDDHSDWYKRIENNGWRLVSNRLLQSGSKTEQILNPSHDTISFHYNKLQRQEDVKKMKKLRKIEWMKKMYQEGSLQSKIKESQYEDLVNEAVAGMLITVDHEGVDRLKNWEVDELLDWTNGLNFDDYLEDWKQVGTTKNSQEIIENLLTASTLDPFEETLTLTSHSTSDL